MTLSEIEFYLIFKKDKEVKFAPTSILHTGRGNNGQSYLGHGRTEEKAESILLHNLAYIYEINALLGILRQNLGLIPGKSEYPPQSLSKFVCLKKIQAWLQQVMAAMYQNTPCPEVPFDIEPINGAGGYIQYLQSLLKETESNKDALDKIKKCILLLFGECVETPRYWSDCFHEALTHMDAHDHNLVLSWVSSDSYESIRDALFGLPGVVRDFILPSGPNAHYFWAATLVRRLELENAKRATLGDELSIQMRPTLNILSAWLYAMGFKPLVSPDMIQENF